MKINQTIIVSKESYKYMIICMAKNVVQIRVDMQIDMLLKGLRRSLSYLAAHLPPPDGPGFGNDALR